MMRKLILLVGIMLVLSIGAGIIVSLSEQKKEIEISEEGDKLQIMTTFYPIYMIGENIAEGIDDIEIKNLTDLNTGCLHDYQLTTEDMRNISESDILIVNGGGMEGFLSDVEENYPGLVIIDSSKGIEMLHNGESAEEHAEHASEILINEHDEEEHDEEEHGEEEHGEEKHGEEKHDEEEHDEKEHDDEGHGHDHGEWNAHVWLDPELYIKQIENVRDGILAYIEEGRPNAVNIEQAVTSNAQAYIDKVASLNQEVKDYAKKFEADRKGQSADHREVVIFHDAFAYLANRIGMKVAYSIPLDSDTSLSAGEIAEIVQEVKKDHIQYLFTEEQFSDSIAKQIAAETGARVYIIDSAVTGGGSQDSYIKAIKANLAILDDVKSE
jgi:zinc transport system substrate-binding protein